MIKNISPANSPTPTRRDFLKITAIGGLALGLGIPLIRWGLEAGKIKNVIESHYLMGTIVNFNILTSDETEGHEIIQATVNEMERLILLFDYRLPDGPLAQLNATGVLQHAPRELVNIVLEALEISDLTQGAFDISVKPLVDAARDGVADVSKLRELVDYRKISIIDDRIQLTQFGMAITLDGIAKGFIVDGGVKVLRSLGFDNVLVEAGGDMMASNSVNNGNDWMVGVSNPRSKEKIISSFSVKNKAVATSGDYLNYFTPDFLRHHIIDPRSGISPTALASVTTIASNATQADALSTAFMVLEPKIGLALAQNLPGVEVLLITKDLSLYHTVGFYTTN